MQSPHQERCFHLIIRTQQMYRVTSGKNIFALKLITIIRELSEKLYCHNLIVPRTDH